MNDVWTERLKVIKDIILIVVPLITMALAAAGVKIASDVHGQQQVNTVKIDEAKVAADEAKHVADKTNRTVEETKKTVESNVIRMGGVGGK